ncbi:hypothetical protein GJ744_000095 [Endocarpon pusillum]|uniref:Uncharacterized protein n=1 Tax=Endocarpon pusillum TaxID=364733 RepID=A0A8H7B053_9EURO|nr:hypothetical protein GJ744_000095 [Endocarpon pusillum]
MTAGHRMDRHITNEYPRMIYPRVQKRGFRVSTEAVNFFKEIWSDDYEEYADICLLMDQDHMVQTNAEVETFLLRTLGGNVATQDHSDDADAPYGVAGIVTFGDFQADLTKYSGSLD